MRKLSQRNKCCYTKLNSKYTLLFWFCILCFFYYKLLLSINGYWRCFGVIEFRVEDPLGVRIGALSLTPNFFKFQKKGGTEMAEEPIRLSFCLVPPSDHDT